MEANNGGINLPGKDAYFFAHDSNARDDPKCCLLIDQLGLEGYGIYWVLIETLRDQPGYRYPLALLPVLARRYNTTPEKARVVVGNYGLFVVDDSEFFLSPALCRRMAHWDEKRELNRLKGIKSGERRRLQAATRTGSELQLNSGSALVEQEHNITRQDNIYNKQHTTEPNSGQIAGVDNSLLKMNKIIGAEEVKRWLSERGHEYCIAQVAAMAQQGDNVRSPRQWLLSALQGNWAKWQPSPPKANPNCPQCGGQGLVVDLAANITKTCSCVQAQLHLPRQQPATESEPPGDRDPLALATMVAARMQA